MALKSAEELFIERPLFPVTSIKKFICNVIGFTVFHLSEAATGGVLLENTCGKASFLIKLQAEATAPDLSRVFS